MVKKVANDRNWHRTAAIEVCLSFNFAVVFDFMYFRFRPSIKINRQCPNKEAKRGEFLGVSFSLPKFCGSGSTTLPTYPVCDKKKLKCALCMGMVNNCCVNTKDGMTLPALIYSRNNAPCAIRQCATILQRL